MLFGGTNPGKKKDEMLAKSIHSIDDIDPVISFIIPELRLLQIPEKRS